MFVEASGFVDMNGYRGYSCYILGVLANAYWFTPNLLWSSKLVLAHDLVANDAKISHYVLPNEGFSVEGIHIWEITWPNHVAFCVHHAENLVWSRILHTFKPPGEVWHPLEIWYGAQASGAKQGLDQKHHGFIVPPSQTPLTVQTTHGNLASMRDAGAQLAESMVLAHFIGLVPKCEHDVEKRTLRVMEKPRGAHNKPRGPQSR